MKKENLNPVEQIVQAHTQVEYFERQRQEDANACISAAIDCGTLLLTQKAAIKEDTHARWQTWCKENISVIGERTRERYMKLAHFVKINPSCMTEIRCCHSLNEAYRYMDKALKPKIADEPADKGESKPKDQPNLLEEAKKNASALYSVMLKMTEPSQLRAVSEYLDPILDLLTVKDEQEQRFVELDEAA